LASRSLASVNGASIPAEACVAPIPGGRSSTSCTEAPRRASSYATADQTTPAPTTMMSKERDNEPRVYRSRKERQTVGHARAVLCGGVLSVNPDTWTGGDDRVNCRQINRLPIRADILFGVRPLREVDKKFVRSKEIH
jgi:hypothetical protein